LIVGFAILILVFANVGWTEEIDRETCHASVILRGTLPDITATNSKNFVNLKCQTAKFCITDKTFGKGECEIDFGEEEFETVRVSKDKNKTEEEINRFVARELASCWAMMGQGKVQIFTRETTTEKRCSICSRIAFDKSLKEELKEGVNGLGNYLLTREVPNQDVSYWGYLTNDLDSGKYSQIMEGFSTEQKAIVFIEIGTLKAWSWFFQLLEGAGWGAIGAKTGGVVGSVFGPVGIVTGGTIGLASGIIFGWIDGGNVGESIEGKPFVSGHAFRDYSSEELKDLECSSFESIS